MENFDGKYRVLILLELKRLREFFDNYLLLSFFCYFLLCVLFLLGRFVIILKYYDGDSLCVRGYASVS